MEHLFNIELYYSFAIETSKRLDGEEFKHCTKVMRHSVGDEIYITNGTGKIFLAEIKEIDKNSLTISLKKVFDYKDKLKNISFCIPKLKYKDRFEFALEKCTELGITNFIIFDSERAIHKSDKKERWGKIVQSAMKQSLRSYLPDITVVNSLNDINNFKGNKIILEQNSERKISDLKINPEEKYYFIFGPEGSFTKEEFELFDKNNFYSLAYNRLRTETAVIKCASIIGQ